MARTQWVRARCNKQHLTVELHRTRTHKKAMGAYSLLYWRVSPLTDRPCPQVKVPRNVALALDAAMASASRPKARESLPILIEGRPDSGLAMSRSLIEPGQRGQSHRGTYAIPCAQCWWVLGQRGCRGVCRAWCGNEEAKTEGRGWGGGGGGLELQRGGAVNGCRRCAQGAMRQRRRHPQLVASMHVLHSEVDRRFTITSQRVTPHLGLGQRKRPALDPRPRSGGGQTPSIL